jgi:hypothetical protein
MHVSGMGDAAARLSEVMAACVYGPDLPHGAMAIAQTSGALTPFFNSFFLNPTFPQIQERMYITIGNGPTEA